ncbi:MAG: CBU_0592 family membrane protein [Francisellaceae bacterium]
MNYDLFDLIGNLGVIALISSYFLLQIGKIAPSALYSSLNLTASVLILISLCHSFNLSSFLIELFWIIISLIGLYRS